VFGNAEVRYTNTANWIDKFPGGTMGGLYTGKSEE
jgi:hypothetical protein